MGEKVKQELHTLKGFTDMGKLANESLRCNKYPQPDSALGRWELHEYT
jgi:hypothetical protein